VIRSDVLKQSIRLELDVQLALFIKAVVLFIYVITFCGLAGPYNMDRLDLMWFYEVLRGQ